VPVAQREHEIQRGALVDVLVNGLSQDRVRRLFGHAAGRTPGLANLPYTWAQGLQPGAALFELELASRIKQLPGKNYVRRM